MRIQERTVGSATILALHGKLVPGEDDKLLKDEVSSLLIQGRKHIVLNLDGVTYLDSAGLAALLAVTRAVHRNEGEIRFVQRRPLTWLFKRQAAAGVEWFDKESDAVRSFQMK